jgi:hypothetical protein
MIRNISTTSKYMQVMGGSPSTYLNTYTGAQGVGNLRYNTTNQQLEVYDGSNWTLLNMSYADVRLSTEAETLLDWAKRKQHEEAMLEKLAQENTTVKDLVDQIKEKQTQIKMVQTLLKSSGEHISPSMVP